MLTQAALTSLCYSQWSDHGVLSKLLQEAQEIPHLVHT